MKHIKRRFFLELDSSLLSSNTKDQIKTFDHTLNAKELHRASKNSSVYLLDEEDKSIGAVVQK